jgi:hypothetical protein
MPDVGHERAAARVQVAAALLVDEVAALASHDAGIRPCQLPVEDVGAGDGGI